MGGVLVPEDGSFTLADDAVIAGASESTANIRSAGNVSQDGGTVKNAAGDNVLLTSGAKFVWNAGSNETSAGNGITVEEGALLSVTSKDAVLADHGSRGIYASGEVVIDSVYASGAADCEIKVTGTGTLQLNGGTICMGSWHGISNAGRMTMTGGQIFSFEQSGIVNTGDLKITGGGIYDNADKGILNKHGGTAIVVDASVEISGNRIGIGNEDHAYFELANADLTASTSSNIYCWDGEMYIHDIVIKASKGNNVRLWGGTVKIKDVTVDGNFVSSGTSAHGVYLEGGTLTAENLTIQNTKIGRAHV